MSTTDNEKPCVNLEHNMNKAENGLPPQDQGDAAEESGDQRISRMRELNDRLRREGRGGIIHMTNGIAALGLPIVNAIFQAIVAFEAFTSDNDPWGELDCAVMEVKGHRVIWKIDLYEEPFVKRADGLPVITRVLTIMLADEY